MKVVQLNQEGRVRLARLAKMRAHIDKMTALYEKDWLEFADIQAELLGINGMISIKSAVRQDGDILLRISDQSPPRARRRTRAREA